MLTFWRGWFDLPVLILVYFVDFIVYADFAGCVYFLLCELSVLC